MEEYRLPSRINSTFNCTALSLIGLNYRTHKFRLYAQFGACSYLYNGTLQIIFPDERNLCTLASLELSLYGGGQHV
jgi:hypothetical protein